MLAIRARHWIAWLGAAAFGGSLAYFVRFYTYTLGSPPPPGGPGTVASNVVINTVLFTAFALHHSVLARPAVKARLVRIVPAALERSLYVWISSALFFAVCFAWQRVPSNLSLEFAGPWIWIGWAMRLAGLTFIVFGVRSIDPRELAGLRQLTGGPQASAGAHDAPRISAAFPYNIVRHPIYLGWMLTTFGASPVTADRLLFSALSGAYLVMAIPWEERALITTFGEEYRAYRARIRWRLLPGLY